MALEVAVHPAAAVDEQHRRRGVGAGALGRDVEPGLQRPLGAVDLEVAQGTDRLLPADHALLAAQLGAGLRQRQGLGGRNPGEPLQREQQLDLGRQLESVDHHRPAVEDALDADRQVQRRAEGEGLGLVEESGHGRQPMTDTHCSCSGVRLRPCRPRASRPRSVPTRRRAHSTRACASYPPTSSTSTRRTTRTRSTSSPPSSRTASSTASSPGCGSTSGCSSWPRTTTCRCSSGRASWPSSPATSTSSSWSAWPASSAASPPASPYAPRRA